MILPNRRLGCRYTGQDPPHRPGRVRSFLRTPAPPWENAVASIDKKNGKYRARWYDEAGKRQSKSGFPRKIDAQRFLDEITADKMTGRYVTPQAGRVTFREYAEEWRTTRRRRANTNDTYERHLRLHIYPAIGDFPLSAITPSMIQKMVNDAKRAPSSVQRMHQVTSAILASAVRDKRIAENPAHGTVLPEVVDDRVLPLTTEQVYLLADTIHPKQRALVLLAAGTGLRQGELWGLDSRRIDLDRRIVHVDRQLLTAQPDGTPVFGPPKTDASYRTVPLADTLAEVVVEHLAKWPPAGPWGLVFTNSQGRPWRRGRWWNFWDLVRTRCDLPGVSLHDLRHYYASLLIRHGASPKTVQAQLGHASSKITMDTYGHLWHDADDQVRSAVDAVFTPRRSQTGPRTLKVVS